MRIVCVICNRQAIPGPQPADDEYVTTLDGARAGFRAGECFCGHCLERELAEARKDAERYEAKLFALGAMEEPPCFKCGYNGPGYFQTATHPCAHNHHNAMLTEREKE